MHLPDQKSCTSGFLRAARGWGISAEANEAGDLRLRRCCCWSLSPVAAPATRVFAAREEGRKDCAFIRVPDHQASVLETFNYPRGAAASSSRCILLPPPPPPSADSNRSAALRYSAGIPLLFNFFFPLLFLLGEFVCFEYEETPAPRALICHFSPYSRGWTLNYLVASRTAGDRLLLFGRRWKPPHLTLIPACIVPGEKSYE